MKYNKKSLFLLTNALQKRDKWGNFQPVESFFQPIKFYPIKTSEILLLGGAGVLAYSLLRKEAGLKRLSFFPDKVHSFSFDGLTPVFQIGFGVQNVNNQSFTINAFVGQLFALDDNNVKVLVGDLSDYNREVIPPISQGILLVTARLKAISILNELIDAFQTGNLSRTLIISAYANVDGLVIPINQTIKVGA